MKQLTLNKKTHGMKGAYFLLSPVSCQRSVVKCPPRGFTLVELFVVVSVMAIVSSVVLSNYRGYSTNAEFANASEDIVLALRQAQVYGSSSKKNVDASGTQIACGNPPSAFNCAYGVFLSMSARDVTIYADATGDQKYNTGDTQVEVIPWKSPISITNFSCSVDNGVSFSSCGGALDVTFKRPNPDAVIYAAGFKDVARLTLSNGITGAGAKTSTITITSAGQISLQ